MRYTLRILLCLLVLSFGASVSAKAEYAKDDIEALARVAHDLLPTAKTSNGELIGEEQAKKLIYPLVPPELIEFVVVRGHIAGFAKFCGLDWQDKYYLPLMSFLRTQHKDFSDHQFAYIGLLHGISMSNAESSRKGQTCDDTFKQKIEQQAAGAKKE